MKSSSVLLFILVPLGFFLYIFSNEIITILYKRGAFNKYSVALASDFFGLFALTLPFLALNTIASRVFMAAQKIKASFFTGIAVNITYLGLLYIMIKNIGYTGFPLSVLIYLPISVLIVNYFLFKKYFPFIEFTILLKNFFKTAILNISIAAAIFALSHYLSFQNLYFTFLYLVICFISYLIILLVGNKLFMINPDVNECQDFFIRKILKNKL